MVQRQIEEEEKEEEEILQTKEVSGYAPEVSTGIESRINEMKGGGQPLPESSRAFFEPRFGYDFSDVCVHNDSRAAVTASAVNAKAFTLGRDVVFGEGQYRPESSKGKSLLAHELTHVVQQHNNKRHADMAICSSETASKFLQRRVRAENVSCHNTGLTNPNLTGAQAVAVIQAADAEAITLALRAQRLLEFHLLFARIGDPRFFVDPAFDLILQQELGLTLTNPADFPIIEQQADRFRRVRELLESGYLRYICRGNTVSLVGCQQGACGLNYAFSCPANRLVVLCQTFWDIPNDRPATILHEPFHVLFHMGGHAPNIPRRADALCFESFALRVAGSPAPASCVGHTAG